MAEARRHRLLALTRAGPFRIVVAALAVLLPVAAVFAGIVGRDVNNALAERTLEELRMELRSLRLEFDRGGMPALSAAVAADTKDMAHGLFWLSSPDEPLPVAGNLESRPSGLTEHGGLFEVGNAAGGQRHAAVGLVVPIPGGGELLVARDIEDQRAFATRLQRLAFAAVGFMSLGALALGWIASRRALARVSRLAEATQAITVGEIGRRLPRDGSGDEIDTLSAGVNAMLSRIEVLMTALREVSDNIAHDLKTPLTRLRNRAEAALRDGGAGAHREGLERTIEEADGLIQTFNALLLIARLEAGAVDQTRSNCDVAALVADAVELYQPVAEEAGLSIQLRPSAPVQLSINRQLVVQAVANLIDNAIKYSAGVPGASSAPITVRVDAEDDGAVAIAVADHGPGIAPADRERAVKRFVRLEQSRSRPGTGLGLSLVCAVARLHGGSVRLEDNQPGLKVILRLSAPVRLPRPVVAVASAAAPAGGTAPVSGPADASPPRRRNEADLSLPG